MESIDDSMRLKYIFCLINFKTMKKIILFVTIIVFTAVGGVAAVMMPQYVVTDCGTVHQIPSGSSVELACALLDYWSDIDCTEESPQDSPLPD
ncbi:MAG: hypothetical protein LBF17_00775 [Mediterranea sp.]|jgi:hypothetical protein|nr:hypothetical protein [Mediterranea sp.]